MIACIRASPKAPRVCLLASTFCSSTTWVDSVVMFCCALSMTASRSASRVEVLVGVAGGVEHRLAELVAEPVHPLGKALDQVRLAGAEHLGDGLHPALHLALGAEQIGELRLHDGAALGARHRPPPGDEEHEDERPRRPAPAAASRLPTRVKAYAADLEGLVHACPLSRRIRADHGTKHERNLYGIGAQSRDHGMPSCSLPSICAYIGSLIVPCSCHRRSVRLPM